MHIKERHSAGVTILHLEGDLISQLDHARLKEHVQMLVNTGQKHLVFDLGELKYINSCGLGSLVCAFTMLRRVGGDMHIARPGEMARELFHITHLDTILLLHDSLDDALTNSLASTDHRLM